MKNFIIKFKNWLKKKKIERVVIEHPNLEDLDNTYSNVWKNKSIPREQMKITEKELPDIINNINIKHCIKLIKNTGIKNPKVLEIGCSTGYISQALKLSGINDYEGCDLSEEFIRIAKEKYPNIQFKVDDATKLSYKNNEFNIVISGCCLLHIVDYQKAIFEAVRVSNDFVMFYRTPVLHTTQTSFTIKNAYGFEMLEILFNESELMTLFNKNGLVVIDIKIHAQSNIRDIREQFFIKSYLCKKK